MYASVRNRPAEATAPAIPVAGATPRRRVRGPIAGTVVLLGLVSLFTDLAQEMVVAVLPLYLTVQLGLSPLAFGLIDGLYQGATAFVRLLGGLVADKRGRYKEIAALGYGVSAFCKLGLIAAGGAWLATTAVLLVDRLGKGVRTAPRDALISLSSERTALGINFGVHRALDTVGAMLGPLAAFMLLAAVPGGYDSIFLVSFCVALVGLGILLLFVRNRPARKAEAPAPVEPAAAPAAEPKVDLRAALGLLRIRRFRAIVLAGGGLALLSVSDAFLYLVVQRQADLSAKWFPLLFLGTALAYLSLAVPVGRLADKVGRGRVFIGGHLAFLAVYLLLGFAQLGTAQILLALSLLGIYYACTDGVLMALASTTLPERLVTSGFALVTTATATMRFGSSLLFGAAWTVWGPQTAILAFLVAMALAVPVAALVLRRSAEPQPA